MTYNLANPLGSEIEAIATEIQIVQPDIVGIQECADCEQSLLGALSTDFASLVQAEEGVGLIYNATAWEKMDAGHIALGPNDDGWGRRIAVWAQLESDTGCMIVYSTHWCVPIRSDDDTCDADKQVEYATKMLTHAESFGSDSSVVFLGDFNVFGDFERAAAVQTILAEGYSDVIREAIPAGNLETFQGNSWAPPGRIDYIFAKGLPRIDDAGIALSGPSDHYPVWAKVAF